MLATRVGYTGGSTPSPTYSSVCANDGHTEAIQVTFDRTVIRYEQILDVFFSEHNPTVRAVRDVLRCSVSASPRSRISSSVAQSAVQERHLVPQPGAGAKRASCCRLAGGAFWQVAH